MIWKPNTLYEVDGTGQIEFFGLDVSILCERFKDGRISGLLSENVVDNVFDNIHKVETEKSNYDVIDDLTNTKIEIRVITKNGVKLIPSNMIGAGRKYNYKKFMEKLDLIGYYIFVDVRELPIMRIFSISSDSVRLNINKPIRQLSIKQINSIIDDQLVTFD